MERLTALAIDIISISLLIIAVKISLELSVDNVQSKNKKSSEGKNPVPLDFRPTKRHHKNTWKRSNQSRDALWLLLTWRNKGI